MSIECFLTGVGKDKFLLNLATSQNGIIHQPELGRNEKIKPFDNAFGPTFNKREWTKNPIAVIGTLRGTHELIQLAMQRKHTFYYLDHAYFHATRNYVPGPHGRLYRMIRSQLQLNYNVMLEDEDWKRIKKYGEPKRPKEFVKQGSEILIIPPTEAIARVYGFDVPYWLEKTQRDIRAFTDKVIRIRYKDTDIPLQESLKNAYCVVAFQSTVAIEAILSGIPCIVDPISQAKPVSSTTIADIEELYYPTEDEIMLWQYSLLACQFTENEFKTGEAYEATNRLQHDNWI